MYKFEVPWHHIICAILSTNMTYNVVTYNQILLIWKWKWCESSLKFILIQFCLICHIKLSNHFLRLFVIINRARSVMHDKFWFMQLKTQNYAKRILANLDIVLRSKRRPSSQKTLKIYTKTSFCMKNIQNMREKCIWNFG